MISRMRLSALTAGVVTTLSMSAAIADVELHIAAFANYDQAIKYAIPLYEAQNPDVKINLVGLAFDDHHNAMTTSLSTGANVPDVMAIEVDYIGKFTNSGGLVDLSEAPYHANQLKDKFSAFTVALGTGVDGSYAGLPADIGPGALFYNSEVLTKAGVNSQNMIKDWDSFIQAGKQIKEKTGGYLVPNVTDVKDVMIRVGLNEGEGIYFDSNSKPLVESDRFKNAFRIAKQMRELKLDAQVGTWSSEWAEGLGRGDIAVQMSGSWMGGNFRDWISVDKPVWRTSQLPNESFVSYGGTFLSIPTKADQKEEAWKFIQFMVTNVEVQEQVFEDLGIFPSLLEAQKTEFMNEPVAYLGGQVGREVWKKSADNIPSVLSNKYDPIAKQIVNDALESVLNQNVSIDDALADAAKLIKRRARR